MEASFNFNKKIALIEVRNYAQLAVRFGEQIARSIEAEVAASVTRLWENANVRSMGGGLFTVTLASVWTPLPEKECEGHLSSLLARLSASQPLASLEGKWLSTTPVAAQPLLDFKAQALLDEIASDVQVVESVRAAMGHSRLTFAYQPVCASKQPNNVLYFECLIRVRSCSGGVALRPSAFIPCFERLGLMYCLDRFSILHAIALLKANFDLCLGINVSARSVLDNTWWTSVFDDLKKNPQVAARLFVEFTETMPLPKNQGVRFARQLQGLGCRVVVDDFGAGHGEDTANALARPNIIKIDGSFAKNVTHSSKHLRRLIGIVRHAREFGSDVVVEGIECAGALQAASLAGADWVQGYYIGVPAQKPVISAQNTLENSW